GISSPSSPGTPTRSAQGWQARINTPGAGPAGLDADVATLYVDWPDDVVHRREELIVGQAGQIAIDQSLVVGDHPLYPIRQAHVLESLSVQAPLLPWQIGVVLGRYGGAARVIGSPGRRSGRGRRLLAGRVAGERP